ncbi:hypothetical protein JL720_7148 [Aureococcus anophagefferens]|nr:hypothetical protein JL720_7148 [Aureococcus anophagefferens]
MARAAPASSSEQTVPRASDAHDDAPAPPADDAPAPRESFAGAVDASGCARGRVASRFLGNDLLGGHSRCTAIPLLTLMVFLQFVLTFAVPTLRPYLDARMPAALDDGAWTNVVAYALVCVPTGLAFQAVSAGNVPGAPLSWSAFSVVGLGLFTYVSVRRYGDFAGSYEDRCFLVVNPITGAVAARRLLWSRGASRRRGDLRDPPASPSPSTAAGSSWAASAAAGGVKLSDVFFGGGAGEPVAAPAAEPVAAAPAAEPVAAAPAEPRRRRRRRQWLPPPAKSPRRRRRRSHRDAIAPRRRSVVARSRPFVVVAAALFGVVVLAYFTGYAGRHWRTTYLGRLADSVDDVEAELRAAGLDPADYVGDLLPEAAKLLRTVQRDLNVSAKVAVPLASLLMLRRFFLMSLGYIILENTLVFFIFACVNEYPRGVLWDHRLTLVVFAAASAFMGCVVDPLVMHGYCSDGYRARRPAAFAVAYASYVAYGLLVGAALFVSRVLTSVVFCLFHLVSLDVCVLPERYAHLDASHVAFMSLVYAHRRHHDAALHVAAEAFAARKPRHSRARTRSAGRARRALRPSSSPSRPSSSSRPAVPRAKLRAAESDGNVRADE